MYFRTHALILSSYPVGEFDFLIRALSADWGLLVMRLRGARRARARLRFLKEPAVFADLQCFGRPGQPRPAKLLTGTLEESFVALRGDLDRLRAARELLRFSELFLTPYDPRAQEKLCLLFETLSRLNIEAFVAPSAVLSLKLKMLELSGWRLSGSQTARHLDAPERLLCEALEQGRPLGVRSAQSLEKLSRLTALYVDQLVTSASA